MRNEINVDVAVIGAGVTGLLITKNLVRLGYKVALIEKEDRIAPGPSSRNQGWLHRGTYHAAMIPNPGEAQRVSRNCSYGYSEIIKFAPEAIEDAKTKTYALIRNNKSIPNIIERWRELKIPHKRISKKFFKRDAPEINTGAISDIYEVKDVSINTRLFYDKLAQIGKELGARIFLQTSFSFVEPNCGLLTKRNGERSLLKADKYVIAVGYSAPTLYRQLTGSDLDLRLWRSHLLILPRLTKHNMFYLDSNEATVMNHKKISIVSQQQDATEIRSVIMQPNMKKAQIVFEALKRLVTNGQRYAENYLTISCIKPEILTKAPPSMKYSVDISVLKPIPGHIFAFPGKMTEAPFISKKIIKELL